MEVRGLKALEDKIKDTYEKEKAPEVLTTLLAGDTLKVTVSECPAVKHLHATGREVSPWYRYTTEVVMEVLAQKGGYVFTMEHYDEATGAAMLAAKAAGNVLPSLQIEKSYEPSENRDLYEQKYRKFKTIEKKLWSKEDA